MKVILNGDVENLGEEGDVLDVAPGYARNFLLPKGLVLAYNDRNLAKIEERREAIEQRKETKRTEAMSLKDRLETEDLTITMTAGRNGRLFGSVTGATIVEHLAANGIEIERKKLEVPDKTIKATGNYKVKVRLYGGSEALLTVRVEADSAKSVEESVEPESAASEADGENADEVIEEIEDRSDDADETGEVEFEREEDDSTAEFTDEDDESSEEIE